MRVDATATNGAYLHLLSTVQQMAECVFRPARPSDGVPGIVGATHSKLQHIVTTCPPWWDLCSPRGRPPQPVRCAWDLVHLERSLDLAATGKRQGSDSRKRQESERRATGERQESGRVFFATGRRQEGDRKATGVRQESDRPVEDNKWDKIVHGFLYRWIYVKKMRTNVLHLFGFL